VRCKIGTVHQYVIEKDKHKVAQTWCKCGVHGILKGTWITGDEDILTMHAPSSVNNSQTNIKDTNQGPVTRSRAKKLQQEVNALLYEFHLNVNKNYILPKSCTLLLLKFTMEDGKDTQDDDYKEELHLNQASSADKSKRNSHIF
jgi:hypothetical protein